MAHPKTDATGQIQKPSDKPAEAPAQAQATAPATAAPIERKKAESLAEVLNKDSMVKEIKRALPKHLTADRMVRIATTALRTTRNLSLCLPETFFGSLLQASQLGLEVNTPLGHAWLIPRKNGELSRHAGRDVYECTLMIGYQGMIDLSRRAMDSRGEHLVVGIRARGVRLGDEFEWEDGLYPKLFHRRSTAIDRQNMELTHAYAVAKLAGDEREFEVLTRAEVEERKARSAAAKLGSSPWNSDYEAMANKSAVRALWKWLPKSSEMATAEQLETASDMGRTQGPVIDDRVHESLERLGLNALPSDTDATLEDQFGAMQWDAMTGEVAKGQERLPVE
jgi:recombination protein RecT